MKREPSGVWLCSCWRRLGFEYFGRQGRMCDLLLQVLLAVERTERAHEVQQCVWVL